MSSFVPSAVSSKFAPGSPDCVLSTEHSVKLQIGAAAVKALAESIFPIIFRGGSPAISSDGTSLHYRGAFDPVTGTPYGRGLSYEGSLFNPETFEIGLFGENGVLKEGYRREITDQKICYMGIKRTSITVYLSYSDGHFVRGICTRHQNEQSHPQSTPSPSSQETELPLPLLGGEIYGPSLGGVLFKGTFHPNGTYTGSLTYPNEGPYLEGVFSFKELPQGGVTFEQISGTYEGLYTNGTRIKVKISTDENQIEGRETSPNGSFRAGLFRFENTSDGGGFFKHLSGPVEIKEEDGTTFKGRVLSDDQLEGRKTWPNGSFKDGIFSIGESPHQTGFFKNQISGTFKTVQDSGLSLEGRMLGDNGNWNGSITYPNGDFKNGEFRIFEKSPRETFCFQLSGTFKHTIDNSSILEGTLHGEGKGTGRILFPNALPITGTIDTSKGGFNFVPDRKREIVRTTSSLEKAIRRAVLSALSSKGRDSFLPLPENWKGFSMTKNPLKRG